LGYAQDTARKILKKVPVQYPLVLKMKGIGGTVRLKVFIKPDGSVRDTAVLGGSAILAESAQNQSVNGSFLPAALKQPWKSRCSSIQPPNRKTNIHGWRVARLRLAPLPDAVSCPMGSRENKFPIAVVS